MDSHTRAAELAGLLSRARGVLERLEPSQRFHAQLLSQELGYRCDASSRSIHDLTLGVARGRRADVRELVRRRLLVAVAEDRIVVTIEDLLAAERGTALRTCNELAAASEGFRDEELHAVSPLVRTAVSLLGRALVDALELRVLAESLDDDDRARLLAQERERWAELLDSDTPTTARVAAREPARPLRPLVGRIVLALADAPLVRARLAAAIEEAGASTVVVDTRAAALELLRWFRVDAIIAAVERRSDTLLHLPHGLDRTAPDRPYCLALLLPDAGDAAPIAESFGYDAAIPFDASDAEAVADAVGAVLEARRLAATIQ